MTEARRYVAPVAQIDGPRPDQALRLAGGWCWFDEVIVFARGHPPERRPARELTDAERVRLTAPRAGLPGSPGDRPAIMGILNVTPDSFSDGGLYLAADAAVDRGRALAAAGADLIDVGGESTRPGATDVPVAEEVARTAPVVAALTGAGLGPVSIDTRKAAVAEAALSAGATLLNDVSALSFDPALAGVAARGAVPVCLMHARGTPQTMQDDPRYGDVLLDVYDTLEASISGAETAGIPRSRLLVDPGIGFGKTVHHNLTLLRHLSLLHGLGCQILLGASRKGFIGVIGGGDTPPSRMPGSIAVALWAVAQGVQVVRVHDVAETRQALSLQAALSDAGRSAGATRP